MNKQTTPTAALSDLVEDAQVLLEATANLAGDKVVKARKRLAAALKREISAAEASLDNAADLAEETVGDLHKMLTATRDRGLEMYDDVRDEAVKKAKAANEIVHENPYRAIGIALGVGALIGCLASFRHCHKSD